jgi:hypothetical protein
MKPPRVRRTVTLSVLAILLAALSTGSFTICDAFIFSDPIATDDIILTLKAGESELDIAGSGGSYYRFILCPTGSVPDGVYLRHNRDTRGKGFVSVDLVTDTNAPPGHYVLQYIENDVFFLGPVTYSGVFDLTIEEPDVALTACFYAYSKGEILVVNQPIIFDGICSQATEQYPIVQYRWWFNYNGNPGSTPDDITKDAQTSHTYTTSGPKTVRLVVRASNGSEAATASVITVIGP